MATVSDVLLHYETINTDAKNVYAAFYCCSRETFRCFNPVVPKLRIILLFSLHPSL